MIIEKGLTKLLVDIKIDSDPLCKVITSRIWLYFRNGYEENSEWMPLVLGDPPFLPPPSHQMQVKIAKTDFEKVCNFISEFYWDLRKLENNEITEFEFIDTIENHQRLFIKATIHFNLAKIYPQNLI